jgi:hypothetical protein
VKTKKPAVHIVLAIPKSAIAVLALAKALQAAMAANKVLFPAPTPSVAQLAADIAALDAAETATHTHTVGTVEARDAKLATVKLDLRQLRAYVQSVAEADEANAASIAKEAGMSVGKTPSHHKEALTAKPNKKTSGSVDVAARAAVANRQSHDWELSTDGGKTWTALASTLAARTTVTGLTPGAIVHVRHRAVTKSGPDNWSQAVSVIVI